MRLPHPESIVSSKYVARDKLAGHGQVTAAHLLALASRGGLLATFDAGIAEIVPASASGTNTVHVKAP